MKQSGKFLLAVLLVVCMLPLPVAGETDTIRISTAKELQAFAKSCALDSWSIGKTAVLINDIDMSEISFTGIPTFGGTFDGQGHTISGLSYSKNGSYLGMFRYVQKTGLVKNLNVSGAVTPGGSNSYLGGIAGSNQGKLLKCSFDGTVTGSTGIGAIAGVNLSEGVISDCISKGTVYGEHYVGGTVGKNLGTVISCTNEASVNTVTKQVPFDLEKLDFEHLRSTQNIADITDVGGITGFSAGIVQSCTNTGTVGYEHVGYNIGGIAGRQSGYLDGCINRGTVLGRKDVGGIAGQMEPFTALQYSQSSLESLDSELDRLQSLTNSALDRTNAYRDSVGKELRQIKTYADGAIAETETLTDQTGDLINKELDSVNDATAKITSAINQVGVELESMDGVSKDMNDFIEGYQQIIAKLDESIEVDTQTMDQAFEDLLSSITKMQSAGQELSRTLVSFRQALNDAEDMIQAGQNVLRSIENVKSAMNACQTAVSDLRDAAADIETQLKNQDLNGLAGSFQAMKTACQFILDSLKDLGGYFDVLSSAFSQLNQSLTDWNAVSLIKSIRNLSDVLFEMNSAMNRIQKAMTGFRDGLEGINLDSLQEIPDDMIAANRFLEHGIVTLGDCFLGMSQILQDLGEKPIITFEKIDEESFAALDRLYDHISGISSSLDHLDANTEREAEPMLSELKEIGEQIKLLFEHLTDAIPELSDDPEEHFVDISDEDTAMQTTGKVSGSRNLGEVRGDVNTGGITGSMAVEYDFDPEDDITVRGDRSANFLYTTRAIIRDCSSSGPITGKKNYVGGVAGNMTLGCVISSQSSGEVKSTGGDYVGGIAGLSESVIKNCDSKCALSGDDYIGGIAGQAKHLIGCRAAAPIREGDEYLGGIAGAVEGTYTENYFCSDALGGVDSVSYSGLAEPVSFETLQAGSASGLFENFTAVFRIEGETVKTISFLYGESIDQSEIPQIPQREGYYAKWDAERFSDLTCDFITEAEYFPYVTAIEGQELRENDLPAVVCQGDFHAETALNVTALKTEEEAMEGWQINTSDGSPIKKIHYLAPDSSKKVVVLVDNGEQFKKVPVKQDGSYVVFDAGADQDQVLFLVRESSDVPRGIIILGILLLLFLAGWSVIRYKKRR